MAVRLRHASADELQKIAQLSARAFTREYATRAKFFFERLTGPRARPKLARVLEAEGVPVASVRIQDHKVQLGAAVLRLGGIADVGTDPDHRRHGYASRLMRDCVRFMTAEGYDISLLFGLQDFYDRFGYATAMAGTSLTLSAADAAKAPRLWRGRPFRGLDAPAVKRLFRSMGRAIWCNVARDNSDWDFRKNRFDHARVITGKGGKVVAYSVFALDAGTLNVTEVGAVGDAAVYGSLLRDLAETAKSERATQLRLHLPPDHPLALYLTDYGISFSLQYPRNGGGMARILNLESCIKKMLPEWSLQLQAAGFHQALSFNLKTDLGRVNLRCGRGRIRLGSAVASSLQVRLPQSRLTQLLLGYQPPDFVLSKPDVRVAGELRPLLRVLFPQRYAFLWPHDHF